MKWLCVFQQQYSENTPQYGHGDWPEYIDYIGCVVEAETVRKAQNAVKKIYPRVIFNGKFAPMLIAASDKSAKLYTKPADPRLSVIRSERHNAALAQFAGQ